MHSLWNHAFRLESLIDSGGIMTTPQPGGLLLPGCWPLLQLIHFLQSLVRVSLGVVDAAVAANEDSRSLDVEPGRSPHRTRPIAGDGAEFLRLGELALGGVELRQRLAYLQFGIALRRLGCRGTFFCLLAKLLGPRQHGIGIGLGPADAVLAAD